MKNLRLLFAALLLSLGSFIGFAHAAALSDYAENKTVDAILRGQTLGAPVTHYAALYTACPTDSTAGTEVVPNWLPGPARKPERQFWRVTCGGV